MSKLGFILPNLANICLHKSTDAKISPFKEGDENLFEKIREVVGGPFIVFTRKAFVNETFIRKSTNTCKSFVRIDDSQLYPYSMCQSMLTGLYTHWDVDSEIARFKPRQNKTRSFENVVVSHFQRTRPQCEFGSFFTTGRQKKIDCLVLMCFILIATLCLKSWVAFTTSFSVKKYVPLTEDDIQRGSKKRELDALRRHHIQKKAFNVIEMWECERWSLYETTNTVKQHIRANVPCRRSLSAEQPLER